VLKRVRKTKRRIGVGKGTVPVGFTIATDGSLAAVQVVKSSGNAALDHIRRSAPFPQLPPGAKAACSFEVVVKGTGEACREAPGLARSAAGRH
jgi:protein TonB